MSGPVKVQIFGQTYSIQGELGWKLLQKLAKFVDDKMHEIADVTKTVDTQKVAVLAALRLRTNSTACSGTSDHDELLREQAERCLTLVERALKQPRDAVVSHQCSVVTGIEKNNLYFSFFCFFYT